MFSHPVCAEVRVRSDDVAGQTGAGQDSKADPLLDGGAGMVQQHSGSMLDTHTTVWKVLPFQREMSRPIVWHTCRLLSHR